ARVRKASALAWLREFRSANAAEGIRLWIRRRGEDGVTLGRLVAESGWTRTAIQAAADGWIRRGDVVAAGGGELLVDAGAVAVAEDRLLRELSRATEGKIGRALLRERLSLNEPIFALVLDRLQATKRMETRGEAVCLPGRSAPVNAAEALSGRAGEVEKLYRTAGLAPPIASEAAGRLSMGAAEMRGTFTALLRSGTLVRLGSDALLIHADALSTLTSEIRAKHRGRSFDVAWFKAYTGLTRKHAIPLLEYLDGKRVTRNVGGMRVVI
ncbi:MAG TPA: SelB C-terminal domain-containing protein, partial [Acidobacteriaceae bacterium]|nr:SelB C-terminal domain-containing protein [Acidobacteriaceae bacterium]